MSFHFQIYMLYWTHYDGMKGETQMENINNILPLTCGAGRTDNAEHKRVELHMHSKMSDMDGTASAGELIMQAYEWGHKAVAITDTGNVQAFPEMMKTVEKIKKNGGDIKVIYGMEAFFYDISSDDIKDVSIYSVSILVKSIGGIKELYKLVSLSYMKYFHKIPKIPMSELKKYRKYFLLGSGGTDGKLYQALLMKKSQKEIDDIAKLYDYFEIVPSADREINKEIARLAERHGKLCAATGNVHYKNKEDAVLHKIIRSANHVMSAKKNTDDNSDMYFMTTDEMLKKFDYLGEEKAFEVVVTNTNKIADMINGGHIRHGYTRIMPDGNFFPHLPDSEQELSLICRNKAHELYGEKLPELVEKRLEKELDAIISGDFSVHYMTARKLVKYSEDNGYHVIARGAVGSSFAAFLLGITGVDPLAPHYRCPECFHSEFVSDGSVRSGFDLPHKKCPVCGAGMTGDGQDIPFETFMGEDGKKAPDIDLNVSGEFRLDAIQYVRELFGKEQVFRAGVISAVKDKAAHDLVEKYFKEQGISCTVGEMRDLAEGCTGVKICLSVFPGSFVVIPEVCEICDFTPVQFAEIYGGHIPATHFDFHAFDDMFLKIDLIGHDTPTLYKRLEDMTGIKISDVPVSDPLVYKLFTSADTQGIPQFGTDFGMKMLSETKPETFSDLVQIEGLAHGTGAWEGNARELIKNGICTLSEVIGTKDDIMLYLIRKGIEPGLAFKITETVSNGRAEELFDDEICKMFREHDVPEWYIDSCKKIKYLFPKAHAAAYAAAAVKLAWFKLYYPGTVPS